MTASTPIRPGQIWADADYRNRGRTVRIIEVGSTHAITEVVTEAASFGPHSTIGRKSRVGRSSTGLRGYRLVSEPDDTAGSAS